MKKNQWVRIHKALANENRLEILRLLWSGSEKNVTQLSQLLKISVMSTSRNLGILERQGIIKSTGRGNRVFYRIDPDISPVVHRALKATLNNLRR